MMKIQQLIPYLALWFICSSCWSEGDKVTWFYTDSYVYQYVRYDEIVLRAGSFGEVAVQVNDNGFIGLSALQSLFAGLMLSNMALKNRRDFEYRLTLVTRRVKEQS